MNRKRIILAAFSLLVILAFAACNEQSPTDASEVAVSTPDKANTFKVLAIGNSFSEDATMSDLYQIAKDSGFEDVVIGNLKVSGCSLLMHRKNIEGDLPAYEYQKIVDGKRSNRFETSVLYGLLDEYWDFITIQQVSTQSGVVESYNEDIDEIVDYINKNKRNPKAEIAWNMTWAYQAGSKHKQFDLYEKNQIVMYEAICNAVREKIVPNEQIDYIIPSGTAMQNLRNSFIGDNVTRDGYHAGEGAAKYLLGLIWMKTLTGVSIDELPGLDATEGISQKELVAIVKAVNDAAKTPFNVTAQ
jgi:hypothetical protein